MIIKQEIEQAEVAFLDSILQRNHRFAEQHDTYASIMVALSSAIFIFSFSQITDQAPLFWVVLGITAGLATIISLLIVKPPRQMRKVGQKESLMFRGEIATFASAGDYTDKLQEALGSRQAMIDQYGREIYNVAKYYYRPKKVMFKLARNVLLVGMCLRAH